MARGVSRIHKKGRVYPFFPPLSLLFSPLSPLPPSPPLRSRPHIAERLSSPSGSGWSPAAKRYLVHFRLKMLLVTAILSTYSRKFTNKVDKLKA